jgi:hypothetical protein
MFKRALGSVVVFGMLAAGSVQAHHSLSGTYDIKKGGTLTGVLTKVAFTNPHGAMTLEVDNADGSKTAWTMTTGSANTLANLGFGKGGANTVKPGDKVTIEYYPARNGSPLGFIRTITLPDERKIQLSNGASNE